MPDGGSSFLDRERAALGDDADFFQSGEDGNLVSGGNDDLLGGGGDFPPMDGQKDNMGDFESSFPAIDMTNEVGTYHP